MGEIKLKRIISSKDCFRRRVVIEDFWFDVVIVNFEFVFGFLFVIVGFAILFKFIL